MDIFPILFSERLKFRQLNADDIDRLVQFGNNKKISKYILNIPYPYQEPDAVFRIGFVHHGFKNKLRYVFAICLKDTDAFIGEIAIHFDADKKQAQLAYWLGESFWNQGLISESIERIVQFASAIPNLTLIYASCKSENGASIKVLEKNQFKCLKQEGNVLTLVRELQREEKQLSFTESK